MDSRTQERAQRFRELHAGGTFVIANAWDGGSARMLASLGFPALATSSGAAAGVLGRLDHGITLDESLANARLICDSTDLPVSADLEKGFGDAPADTARAIRRAAEVGLVGGSIEDATGRRDAAHLRPRLSPPNAWRRRSKPRAHCPSRSRSRRAPRTFYNGRTDLDDTIRRLQAYERAGADVLFAPALPDLAAVRTVCASVSKPVNFMVGHSAASPSRWRSSRPPGVRRISLAASLYRAAMTGLIDAAREVRESRHFRLPGSQCAELPNSPTT